MELRHIRYFLAVAEERAFTRAAMRLGIGQPPLSQQIRDLESEIGHPLFHRWPHGVTLTEAGKAFLEEVRQVVPQVDGAVRAARSAGEGHYGSVRVGFTSSANFNPVVTRALSAFHWRHPETSLVVEENNTARLVERLVNHELDVAFVRPDNVADSRVRLTLVGDEPLILAMPAGHALTEGVTVPVAALKAEPFIVYARDQGQSFMTLIRAACLAEGFEPVIGQEVPKSGAIINLVAAGLGIALVPASIAQLAVEGVVYRPIEGAGLKVQLALATRSGDVSSIPRDFMELISQAARG